jgi:hypothetical protein
MSEELNNLELRKDEEPEVEAHRRRHFGSDEPSDEGESESEDDFEAHRFRHSRPKKD